MNTKIKTHIRGNWGVTLCGRDGWRSVWSTWAAETSLPSTDNRRKATCASCLQTRGKRWRDLHALALLLIFALFGCDRSMNDSWLNPPSCHRKECMEAEGYNIVGSPSQ